MHHSQLVDCISMHFGCLLRTHMRDARNPLSVDFYCKICHVSSFVSQTVIKLYRVIKLFRGVIRLSLSVDKLLVGNLQ